MKRNGKVVGGNLYGWGNAVDRARLAAGGAGRIGYVPFRESAIYAVSQHKRRGAEKEPEMGQAIYFGNRTVNVVPCPGRDWTRISPP